MSTREPLEIPSGGSAAIDLTIDEGETIIVIKQKVIGRPELSFVITPPGWRRKERQHIRAICEELIEMIDHAEGV